MTLCHPGRHACRVLWVPWKARLPLGCAFVVCYLPLTGRLSAYLRKIAQVDQGTASGSCGDSFASNAGTSLMEVKGGLDAAHSSQVTHASSSENCRRTE